MATEVASSGGCHSREQEGGIPGRVMSSEHTALHLGPGLGSARQRVSGSRDRHSTVSLCSGSRAWRPSGRDSTALGQALQSWSHLTRVKMPAGRALSVEGEGACACARVRGVRA